MAGSPATLNKIERAHQMYREGKHAEALDYYTDALSMAKTKPQKIALHSNRAACYLKLHHFFKAAEECTSVLELDNNHTGALMLRAQTLVTLKEYHSALFDVNRLLELNPSSEVYLNLHARLKTQLSLAPIPEDEAEFEEEDDYVDEVEEDYVVDEAEAEQNEEKYIKEVVEQFLSQEKDVAADAEIAQNKNSEEISVQQKSAGWQQIPKPKGHSHLDYSRWDKVKDDSSEDDSSDDDDDGASQPQYRIRVKTVGVKAVK